MKYSCEPDSTCMIKWKGLVSVLYQFFAFHILCGAYGELRDHIFKSASFCAVHFLTITAIKLHLILIAGQ